MDAVCLSCLDPSEGMFFISLVVLLNSLVGAVKFCTRARPPHTVCRKRYLISTGTGSTMCRCETARRPRCSWATHAAYYRARVGLLQMEMRVRNDSHQQERNIFFLPLAPTRDTFSVHVPGDACSLFSKKIVQSSVSTRPILCVASYCNLHLASASQSMRRNPLPPPAITMHRPHPPSHSRLAGRACLRPRQRRSLTIRCRRRRSISRSRARSKRRTNWCVMRVFFSYCFLLKSNRISCVGSLCSASRFLSVGLFSSGLLFARRFLKKAQLSLGFESRFLAIFFQILFIFGFCL